MESLATGFDSVHEAEAECRRSIFKLMREVLEENTALRDRARELNDRLDLYKHVCKDLYESTDGFDQIPDDVLPSPGMKMKIILARLRCVTIEKEDSSYFSDSDDEL